MAHKTYPGVTFGTDVHIGEHVIIEPGVRIGNGVQIGHYAIIQADTEVGDGVTIGAYTLLGKEPMANRKMARRPVNDLSPTTIGDHVTIGTHCIIYRGSSIRDGVLIADGSGIREQIEIGSNSVIGRNVIIEPNTIIGKSVTIQTCCYVTADMCIEDEVFFGPCCSTANDKYMGRGNYKHRGPIVKKRARIGNNASLLPSITVGEESVVGAGAVVTRDVAPEETVVGNPAKPIKRRQ